MRMLNNSSRQQSQILEILPCERLGVAVTRTRSSMGVWDLRAGALHSTFARDSVGAQVSRTEGPGQNQLEPLWLNVS